MKLQNYLLGLMAMILAPGLLQAQNRVSMSPLWKSDVKTFIENSPVLAHLTGNDESQIVVAGREDLIALDGNGTELWKYRSKGRYMMSPSVLEIKGKPSLIFATDNLGYLRCHDTKGKVIWETKLSSTTSWSAPALADLHEDGNYCVVQGDESGTITACDALTGKMQWKSSIRGMPSCAAIGDLDGKSGLEIAYLSTTGILTILHADGSLFWEKNIGGTSQTWGNAAPVIFVASDGQHRIFAASNNGEAFCYSASGTKLWSQGVKGAVASSLSVGDIDMDGVADLFLITQLGVIYRFTENGEVLWNIDMQGRTLGSGSIIDVNGDGELEYVFCTQDGHLQAIDQHGTTLFDFNFGHRTINVTPTFGEITKKSAGLEMAITGGESGLVYCFKTTATANAKRQWVTSGGSNTRANFKNGLTSNIQLSMIPLHLNWNEVYLGEDICFDVYNPETTNDLISIEASCIYPDGKYQSVTSKLAGHHSQIYLPFNGLASGDYLFKWSLTNPAGKVLLTRKREINITPFQNERSLVQASLMRLKEMASQTVLQRPDISQALQQEAANIEQEFKIIQPEQVSALSGIQTVNGDIVSKNYLLTQKAKKGIQIAELAERSLTTNPNVTILPFEGKLWESRERKETMPLKVADKLVLKRTMVTGENEPVSLNLFNIIGRTVAARITSDSIPKGITLSIQHSVSTIDAMGKPSWDALPELDESRVVQIPSLSSKEIWITISCSQEMKPGQYKIPLLVQALNGSEVQDGPKSPQNVQLPAVRIELEIEVLPFKMAPLSTIRLCAWGTYDPASIRNLLEHGNTVFIVPQGKSVNNSDEFDFSDLDKIVVELKGNDAFLLLSGLPNVVAEAQLGIGNQKLNNYLDKLTLHLAALGVDKKHFAFYPYDEPGGSGWTLINNLVAFAKLVKAKDPELLVYMDGGGEAPMFKAMQPYVDVWCVGYNTLPDKSPVNDIIRKDPGGLLWSYDCSYSYARPMGPNIKNINLVGQFRISALAAFRWNFTGIGYWSYNLGEDMWGRIALEYPLVYKGTTKPINSRRWEAVRESIEDYRIVNSLKALRDQNGSTLTSESKNRIDTLLLSIYSFIDQSDKEMKLGMSRKVMDVTNSEEAVIKLRKELMDCIRSINQ